MFRGGFKQFCPSSKLKKMSFWAIIINELVKLVVNAFATILFYLYYFND